MSEDLNYCGICGKPVDRTSGLFVSYGSGHGGRKEADNFEVLELSYPIIEVPRSEAHFAYCSQTCLDQFRANATKD